MRVIPVLDLMSGHVVRGIAGQRHLYRPWISPLANSSDPFAVARAIRDRFGLTTLYVADLDAIAGAAPALELYRQLQDDGFRLWVDAGIREAIDLEPLRGVDRIVAGLETLVGPDALAEILARCDRVLFSLDMKAGVSLATSEWPESEPIDIARRAVALGTSAMLLLDLSRVGGGTGTGTEELAANLLVEFPGLEVTTGGGVRDRRDLARLAEIGIANVLVASALHEGRIWP